MKLIKIPLILGALCFALLPAASQGQTSNLTDGASGGMGNSNTSLNEDPAAYEDGTTGGSITSGDRNIFYGHRSGTRITTGSGNVILGTGAGQNFTSNSSSNIIIGEFAGSAGLTDDGSGNFALPHLIDATSIDDIIMIGTAAGQMHDNATDCIYIGHEAGRMNNGTDNIFIGHEAGENNTTGVDNTCLGEEAGTSLTDGDDNTFMGEDAGAGVSTGNDNTAIGADAMDGNYGGSGTIDNASYGNTALGSSAGSDLGSPTGGASGLIWNNTYVGAFSGTDNGGGLVNTFIGAHAGTNNEHADYNTFVGGFAGWDNNRTNDTDNANRNTFVGTAAGSINREGEDNVILGAFADFASWDSISDADLQDALDTTYWSTIGGPSSNNDTRSRVIMIGSYATARHNDAITIGYTADTTQQRGITIGSTAQNTHTDAIVIGYNGASHANDTVVIGNSDVSNPTVAWHPAIDAATELGSAAYRFTNTVSQGYDAIAGTGADASLELWADDGTDNADRWQINAADSAAGGNLTFSTFESGAYVPVVTFNNAGDATLAGQVRMNSDARLKKNVQPLEDALAIVEALEAKTFEWKSDLGRTPGRHFGFIAQEVEQVAPVVVGQGRDGMKSVAYQELVPVLAGAVKQLSAENKALRAEVEALKDAAGTGSSIRAEMDEMKLMLQEQSEMIRRLQNDRE